MPNINLDDAYILDETGAQVDKVTGLYFKNENASDTEKAQARANIGAGGTNDNLLDNAYFVGGGSQLGDGVFPINQRGQTSYEGGAGIDRWSSDSQITLTASGITISANAIYQNQTKAFFDAILGKTVTYSILTTGGEVKSATIQFPSSYPASVQVQEIFNDGQSSIGFALFPSGNGKVIRIIGVPVAAAKLELGTVSTIANDVRPDFGAELAKCQHYLYGLTFPGYAYTGQICFALDAQNINWNLTTPVPMVQNMLPSISVTNSLYANGVAISGITIVNYPYGNNIKISGQAGGMTNGQLYPITTSANEVKVLISTEL